MEAFSSIFNNIPKKKCDSKVRSVEEHENNWTLFVDPQETEYLEVF